MKKVNIAVVGATGLVGTKILEILEERDFPIDNLYLLASERSKGKKVMFKGKEYVIEELTEHSFDKNNIDIALFSAGGGTSLKFAPIAKEHGTVVVDNSSAWRMDDDIPLPVPEVNREDIFKHKGIIANPNCSTIQSVVPLKPLHDQYGIKRIVYSTYQAVSGSGVAGIRDLEEGTTKKYPYSIQKNCLPHIDDFLDNGYTKEEMKMVNETHKILHDNEIRITATTVRVPIKNSHAVNINIELEKSYELEDVFKLMAEFPGIVLMDDIKNNVYPLEEVSDGTDKVYVGRIRRDFSVENGLNLWCVADNIRKGAATNTVQIAEVLLETF